MYPACYSFTDHSAESSALPILVGRVTLFDRLGGLTFRCATSVDSYSGSLKPERIVQSVNQLSQGQIALWYVAS